MDETKLEDRLDIVAAGEPDGGKVDSGTPPLFAGGGSRTLLFIADPRSWSPCADAIAVVGVHGALSGATDDPEELPASGCMAPSSIGSDSALVPY